MKLLLNTPKERRAFSDELLALADRADGGEDIQRGQFRIRNTPAALKRVVANIRRDVPRSCSYGTPVTPPSKGRWSDIYPTIEIAAETIARHLEIQGEFMEESQVKACRENLASLERHIEEKEQKEFVESLPDTLKRAVKAMRNATYKLKWKGGKKWKAEVQAEIVMATAELEAEITRMEDAEKVRNHLYLIT